MPVFRSICTILTGLACLYAGDVARAADAALIEAAKKERQVVWYTTLIVNQAVRPLKEAFEKNIPAWICNMSAPTKARPPRSCSPNRAPGACRPMCSTASPT
jgi:hypothetical protein